jgi:rhomboid family GlyGly-CTERM serine protease
MNVEAPARGSTGRLRRLAASLNCEGTRGVALLAICLLLLLPELGGESLRHAWRYEREALAAGEWWRFATAHVVHLDFEHAVLNALGLVLMWALFARDYRASAWLAIVLGSAVFIDLGFWFRDRTLEWYVGSSGVLHGVMVAGTLAHLLRRDLDGWILAAFIILKLGFEQRTGALPFAEGGGRVVVNAHLYGAIVGLLAAAAVNLLRRRMRGEPL